MKSKKYKIKPNRMPLIYLKTVYDVTKPANHIRPIPNSIHCG